MGNASGLFAAVSVGVVSARGAVPNSALLGQRVVDYLFTDAVISPGSSGGPVLDSRGHVVGINTAMVGASLGLGVVIPSSLAYPALQQIERNGRSVHAYGGLEVVDEGNSGGPRRLRVASVVPGGPAHAAELRVSDRITSVNTIEAPAAAEFRRALFCATPGTVWRLGVQRSGRPTSVTMILRELTGKTEY